MEGTLTKKVIGNELYLFNAKGDLIFKRWLDHGYSKVFDVGGMPYGKNDTYCSITDKGIVKK